MGGGPARLVAAGAAELLGSVRSAVDHVELPTSFDHEIGASFAVQRALAGRVRNTTQHGDFPVVLGGNCSCVVGTVAGLELGTRSGVVWFDAHGDVNTPETTPTGFFDGMPVAVLTGRCWRPLASAIPGFEPVADDNVLLAAVRALDPLERELLDTSQIARVEPEEMVAGKSGLTRALVTLARRVDSVHVHVDLDAIDPADGRANEFAEPGGPSLADLETSIRAVGEHCTVNSVSLTSYNPAVDDDERALTAALRLLETLATLAPTRS